MNKGIQHHITLRPLTIPTHVNTITEGVRSAPMFALRELSESVLNQLCDQFREDFLKQARIQRVEWEEEQKSRDDSV